MTAIEKRKKATEKETRNFVEGVRRRFREFVLTLERGLRPQNILGEG